MSTSGGACVVIGAGDGVGGAIAKAFAAEGLTACVTRRPRHIDQLEQLAQEIRAAGGQARAFGGDAREEADMADLFDAIEREVGPIEVVVFNIGANVRFPILETTSRVFTKVWQMACFAGFLTGREAARVMSPRGRGTLIFTGATASVRGREGFAAFNEVMLRFVRLVMWVAPLGIMGLVAAKLGAAQAQGEFAAAMTSLAW
ncbi:MAG TPA: SDR family NAD(P)-dependent oxidoreductase, partial [Phenylobacterium sp.]|nr:SDR family NAD(P)-dependent oxidoreductase [Phenylobacterium sp.]